MWRGERERARVRREFSRDGLGYDHVRNGRERHVDAACGPALFGRQCGGRASRVPGAATGAWPRYGGTRVQVRLERGIETALLTGSGRGAGSTRVERHADAACVPALFGGQCVGGRATNGTWPRTASPSSACAGGREDSREAGIARVQPRRLRLAIIFETDESGT